MYILTCTNIFNVTKSLSPSLLIDANSLRQHSTTPLCAKSYFIYHYERTDKSVIAIAESAGIIVGPTGANKISINNWLHSQKNFSTNATKMENSVTIIYIYTAHVNIYNHFNVFIHC